VGRMPTENGLPQYVSKHARTRLYQYYRRPPKGIAGAAFIRSFGSNDRKTVSQKYAAIHDEADQAHSDQEHRSTSRVASGSAH
jgi:hypothetical protein